jgi:solute carrier family 10 (sodium/bile acid cotransporter), member 7
MTFKSLYLPIGLIIALITSFLAKDFGVYLKENDAVPWFIVLIFLINGFQFADRKLHFSKNLLISLIIGAIIVFCVAPFLALLANKFMALPFACAVGLIVISTMPPTISSGIVITNNSGGDVPKAIFFTLILNGLGVFIIPFILGFFLNKGIELQIDSLPLLKKMSLLILFPFIIGVLMKKLVLVNSKINSLKWIGYIPSTCVIFTVYVSLSFSIDKLMNTPLALLPKIIISVILVHVLLLLITTLFTKITKTNKEQSIAFIFVCSQKTLPVAMSVLAVIGDPTGLALIVCIIFHFLQLLIDSFYAMSFTK